MESINLIINIITFSICAYAFTALWIIMVLIREKLQIQVRRAPHLLFNIQLNESGCGGWWEVESHEKCFLIGGNEHDEWCAKHIWFFDYTTRQRYNCTQLLSIWNQWKVKNYFCEGFVQSHSPSNEHINFYFSKYDIYSLL